jgi:hypothetical protein
MRRLPVKRLDADVRIPTELYFIESQCAERRIKIGVSSNTKTRLVNMRVHSPYKLALLKVVPGGAHLEIEFHKKFAADRVCGEWFRPPPELLAEIDRLPSAPESPKPAPAEAPEPWPAYERRMREQAMQELANQAQELGMGY